MARFQERNVKPDYLTPNTKIYILDETERNMQIFHQNSYTSRPRDT